MNVNEVYKKIYGIASGKIKRLSVKNALNIAKTLNPRLRTTNINRSNRMISVDDKMLKIIAIMVIAPKTTNYNIGKNRLAYALIETIKLHDIVNSNSNSNSNVTSKMSPKTKKVIRKK
jgi:hypothetical protein